MKDDYRVKIIDDLVGINYLPGSLLDKKLLNRLRPGHVNWEPEAVDIEAEKERIKGGFYEALEVARARHLERFPQG